MGSLAKWGDLVTLEYGKGIRGYQDAKGKFQVYGTNGPVGWHKEALCKHPGVIIGRKGAYRGVHYSPEPFYVIDTAYWVKPKIELDLRWAYYALLKLDINGMDSGSAIPSTSREDVYDQDVYVPSLAVQRAVSSLLGALDDRINLNEKLNAALEATAAAVFKSWFVDFDPVVAKSEGRKPFGMPDEIAALFPDRFAPNGLPEGCEPGKVRDLLTLSKQQCNPMKAGAEFFEHYSIPAFDSGQEPILELGSSIKSNKFVVPSRCILVSKLNPTTPRIWWPQESSPVPRICSTEFMVAVPRAGIPLSYCFALSSSADVNDQLCGLVTGTSNSHQRVKPDDFLDLPVSLPTGELFSAFDAVVGPIYARRLLNQKQNRALRKLRDAILPGLVSGELQIKEVQEELQPALQSSEEVLSH